MYDDNLAKVTCRRQHRAALRRRSLLSAGRAKGATTEADEARASHEREGGEGGADLLSISKCTTHHRSDKDRAAGARVNPLRLLHTVNDNDDEVESGSRYQLPR